MTEESKKPQDEGQGEEGLVEKTEKWWEATRKTLNQAGHKATQYKRIVQIKIDLASIHKKIDSAHGDLGKLVDEAHDAGEANILERDDVKRLLEKLDGLKQTAATLEHEIEMIKVEHIPEEQPSPADRDSGTEKPKEQ